MNQQDRTETGSVHGNEICSAWVNRCQVGARVDWACQVGALSLRGIGQCRPFLGVLQEQPLTWDPYSSSPLWTGSSETWRGPCRNMIFFALSSCISSTGFLLCLAFQVSLRSSPATGSCPPSPPLRPSSIPPSLFDEVIYFCLPSGFGGNCRGRSLIFNHSPILQLLHGSIFDPFQDFTEIGIDLLPEYFHRILATWLMAFAPGSSFPP